MSGFRLVLAVLLSLLAQISVVPRIAILGIQPDVTVLLLVLLAMRRGPVTGTLVGFGLGLLQDLLVPERLGMNMLAKSVTGYALGRLGGGLFVGGPGLQVALMGFSVLLHDLIFLLALTGLDLPQVFRVFFLDSVPTAIYTAFLGGVILVVAMALGGGRLFAPSKGDSRASR
ncbi:MAG TPA: rod shape-determining protein MreD [Candidatus Krumholzibacteria bacterium]|jgi:rod shape-determining protein MreD